MDFMDKESSYLISTAVFPSGAPPYVDPKDTLNGWSTLNPSIHSLRKEMRRAYEDRNLLKKKAEIGIERAKKFTWANSVDNFEKMVGAHV